MQTIIHEAQKILSIISIDSRLAYDPWGVGGGGGGSGGGGGGGCRRD
jgi:hypothetical protein